MQIKAQITILLDVSFSGVPGDTFVVEIGGKMEAFTNRMDADHWLREEAVRLQTQEMRRVIDLGGVR